MILLIDNYDSFTYNLAQALGQLGQSVRVVRNDQVTLDEIRQMSPQALVISPGPGRPEDAGISLQAIETFAPEFPILGVCLGHQCLAQAFGGVIIPARSLVHGKASPIFHTGKDLFAGLPNPLLAGRYHSLAVWPDLPSELALTAWTSDGEVMGIAHRQYPCHGVQFHPESILTPGGLALLQNFLRGGGEDDPRSHQEIG